MDTETSPALTQDSSEAPPSDNLEASPTETPDGNVKSDTPQKDSDRNSFDDPIEPTKLKGLTPEQLEEKRKALQADYTRKTMAYAEERNKWESDRASRDAEVKTLRTQLNQLNQLATEVLKDPKKLDAYRQVYGPQLGINQVTQDSIPQFETQEQLISWLNNRESQLEQKLRNELRSENQTFYQKQVETVRWERAVQQMNTDPFFQRHEQAIRALIMEPSLGFIDRFKSGSLDEVGVLKEGMARFKSLIEPELKRVREEALSGMQKKASATTARPSRPMQTERSEALSDAEILQRIQSKLG